MVVVTRSGKVVVGDMKGNDEAQAHEEEKGIEGEEITIQQSLANELQKDVGKSTSIPKLVQPLPKITLPFPQHLKNKNTNEKFKNFLSVFKTLSINLTLVEALLEMPGYDNFMKVEATKSK
ncbi:hypothetical protein KY290_017221 [Solanum tuberosum]|uniref:Uncharacterized protein n=1 Tax=Solanum tuberosum TaxID=4113 RepID=A0ABQ7VAN4_SOLTU|nr:hypothetical protein KY290_017221 [Solanum tuberosum]